MAHGSRIAPICMYRFMRMRDVSCDVCRYQCMEPVTREKVTWFHREHCAMAHCEHCCSTLGPGTGDSEICRTGTQRNTSSPYDIRFGWSVHCGICSGTIDIYHKIRAFVNGIFVLPLLLLLVRCIKGTCFAVVAASNSDGRRR